MSRITRPWLATSVCALAAAAFPSAAAAQVTATRDALDFARAISNDPDDEIVGARFIKVPPRGNPVAISTTSLLGFPSDGKSYGVLSTGDATEIDEDNDSGDAGTSNRGPVYRGARDVTVLRIDVNVPDNGSRCLSFGFKFLSEEFDEFIDSPYNDAFIAELDRSTWSTGGTRSAKIKAPRSFARARNQQFISINGTGDFQVKEGRARGSMFDAATSRLRASTRVTPGRHSLFLSIFDQGDRIYDSAVMIDRLRIDDRKPCVSGTALGS